MNGSQDPRQGYSEGAPSQNVPPPQYAPPQYGAAPPQASVWSKPVSDIGVEARLLSDPRRKSPLLALILSGMPGLGQVYVGYYHQGFINMVVCGGTIFLLNAISHRGYGGVPHGFQAFLGFFLAFYWLYNMVDAYRRAAFYNQALAGLGPVQFPEEMKLPKAGGSMAGGIALILAGLLLFANTALGMSLDWLEQWWPMGLVLIGAWLVYRNVTEKRPVAAATSTPAQPIEPVERS